jgi:4a-hydroxytetrahydrobiopterin dehydratase
MPAGSVRRDGTGNPEPAIPWMKSHGRPRARYTVGMTKQPTPADLTAKKCVPCEGGVPKLTPAEAEAYLAAVPAWRLTHDGSRIRRDFTLPDFRAAVKLVNNIAALAEREQHHPDLHIEGYRKAWAEIHTHAIGGLSENDFILAAKIDAIAPPA